MGWVILSGSGDLGLQWSIIWTWVNSVIILQKRRTVCWMYKHECCLLNMCSNPSVQLNIDKTFTAGFSKVLWVILNLWYQTGRRSSREYLEASNKVAGLENTTWKKRCCLSKTVGMQKDAAERKWMLHFSMFMTDQSHGLNNMRTSQIGMRKKRSLIRR